MKIRKTLRRVGQHKMSIPKAKGLSSKIKMPVFPKLPKLKMPKTKSKY